MDTALIKTKTGGFIASQNHQAGRYAIWWLDKDRNPIKKGSVSEWIWASTSWNKPLLNEEMQELPTTAVFSDLFNEDSVSHLETLLIDSGVDDRSAHYTKIPEILLP